jgi:hypothetical protein
MNRNTLIAVIIAVLVVLGLLFYFSATGRTTEDPCGGPGQPPCPTGQTTTDPCGGPGQPPCPARDGEEEGNTNLI